MNYAPCSTKRCWPSVKRAPLARRIFPPPACPRCGATHLYRQGMKPRRVLTPSGNLSYEREVFQCASCRKSFAPMDGELGVAAGARMNRSLVRRVSYIGAVLSFSSASRALEELLGLRVSSSEIQRVVHEEGARIEARHQAEEERWNAPIDPCREGARAPVAPRAPGHRGRRDLRAHAQTARNTRASTAPRAFALGFAHGRRRGGDGDGYAANGPTPRARADMDDFSGRAKALAWRMGMRTADRVAFVGDGARCLWKWAEGSLPTGTVCIQDFWHVCEHLAALARDLFGERFTPVYHRWKKHLRAGKARRDSARSRQAHPAPSRLAPRATARGNHVPRSRSAPHGLPTLRARRLAHRLGRHRRDLQAPGQRTLQRNRAPSGVGPTSPTSWRYACRSGTSDWDDHWQDKAA